MTFLSRLILSASLFSGLRGHRPFLRSGCKVGLLPDGLRRDVLGDDPEEL